MRKMADRKSTRLNSSHQIISYAVFCLKKKNDRKSTRLNSSDQIISYAVFCLKKKKEPQYGRAFCSHTRCSTLSVIRISCSCFASFWQFRQYVSCDHPHVLFLFFVRCRRPPKHRLFPCTTLFR